MKLEKLKIIDHKKLKNNLELKEEKINKDEANLTYEPISKDKEFKIDVDVNIKQNIEGLDASSKLTLFESNGKKMREFLIKNEIVKNVKDFQKYLDNISDIFEKWRNKNLKSMFDREYFKRTWADEDKKRIIAKVLKKL
jgi:hypothetical protein